MPLLAATTSAGALTGTYGTLYGTCSGYLDNSAFEPEVESSPLLPPPSGGLNDSTELGDTANRGPMSPRPGMRGLRARLTIAAVFLLVFVLAIGVSIAIAAAVSAENLQLGYLFAGVLIILALPVYVILRKTPSFRSSRAYQPVSPDVLRI